MYPRASTFVRRVPSCRQCKHFKSGRCKLFTQSTPDGLKTSIMVEHARGDSLLCGQNGLYFSPSFYYDKNQESPSYGEYEE